MKKAERSVGCVHNAKVLANTVKGPGARFQPLEYFIRDHNVHKSNQGGVLGIGLCEGHDLLLEVLD